jgi:ribosomal protein S18 acetylase RimI-like enzyme
MLYRPYTSVDIDACLAIYDSNAERFFSPGDRDDFLAFLRSPPGFFGVLCDDAGNVVGCGGVGTRDEGRTAVLTWGMVHASLHGRGLGKQLAVQRLLRLCAMPGVEKVLLNTSQETVGFYEKLGFIVVRHQPDGYRQGLDRYDHALQVAPAFLERLMEAAQGMEGG